MYFFYKKVIVNEFKFKILVCSPVKIKEKLSEVKEINGTDEKDLLVQL